MDLYPYPPIVASIFKHLNHHEIVKMRLLSTKWNSLVSSLHNTLVSTLQSRYRNSIDEARKRHRAKKNSIDGKLKRRRGNIEMINYEISQLEIDMVDNNNQLDYYTLQWKKMKKYL